VGVLRLNRRPPPVLPLGVLVPTVIDFAVHL
jgi:hypothetical protein